jgi:hypothetical protein
MESVKKYSYEQLIKKVLNKKTRFISDCEFFPNFDVTGLPINYYIKNNELVFKFKTAMGKTIDIGVNMKNLRFELK